MSTRRKAMLAALAVVVVGGGVIWFTTGNDPERAGPPLTAPTGAAKPSTSSTTAKAKPKTKPSAFVPVQLAGPVPASFPDKFPTHPTPSSVAAPADIRVELRRGPLAISVSWPSAAAPQCAAWLTEMLR